MSNCLPENTFQQRVEPWMLDCFGLEISGDREERNHRFLEEALELVQSRGCTVDEARQMVEYVFSRPIGEAAQEVGGVMVTLAALCLANDLDMHEAGEVELARIWTKIEQIRAKQAAKPKHSPLPQNPSDEPSFILHYAKDPIARAALLTYAYLTADKSLAQHLQYEVDKYDDPAQPTEHYKANDEEIERRFYAWFADRKERIEVMVADPEEPFRYIKWSRVSRIESVGHISRGIGMECWEHRYLQDVPFLVALVDDLQRKLDRAEAQNARDACEITELQKNSDFPS
jgi:hypothetical protein